jgi:hypothetical protein
MLQPHSLLQYCGYGVWNVHRKNGTMRPAAEWVIVENAQPENRHPIPTRDHRTSPARELLHDARL